MGRYVKKFDKANDISDKLYKDLVNSEPIIEYKQKMNKKHIEAKAEALKKITLKDTENINDYHTGIKKLTDAYIAYGKKAGLSHIGEASYHNNFVDVEDLIKQYRKENNVSEDGLLAKMKLGEHDELLELLVRTAKFKDQKNKARFHLSEKLADGKDSEFYESIGHSFAKSKGTARKFSKYELGLFGRRDHLLDELAGDLANDESYAVLDQSKEDQQKNLAKSYKK